MSRAVVIRQNKQLLGDMAIKEIRPEINSSFSMLKYSKDYTVLNFHDQDVALEVNDKIVIPKKEDFVYVSGSVVNPGGISFKIGESASYYVDMAGGYQKRADKRNIYIMTNYDNTLIYKDKQGSIIPGDIIIIPMSQENKTMTYIIIPLVSAISTTVAVMLSIYSTLK